MFKRVAILLCLFFSGAATAFGASAVYQLDMIGSVEVPNPGDPDGLGLGTISLDDVAGMISWDITYSDIEPPTAMHIHTGAAGVSGGVFIGLGVVTTGGPGTLVNSRTWSPLSDITGILNNPGGYYINIHNSTFPAGAIRDQLGTPVPEPATWVLLATAGLALFAVAWHKRRAG